LVQQTLIASDRRFLLLDRPAFRLTLALNGALD
jgi:hypothetical protein